MPKFSIIVPCYNLEPWIRECLDSVLAQSYADWECIVVDDESTDGSGLVLDEYAERIPRLRVIHQRNAGEGGARNAGLAVAEGEWVLFLDGDDVININALERLESAITRYPDVTLFRFGKLEIRDQGEEVEKFVRRDISTSCESAQHVPIGASLPKEDLYTYVWQYLYRRDILKGVTFAAYKRGCDRVYLTDVLLNRASSYVNIEDVLYGYRLRQGSAMHAIPTMQVLLDEMHHREDIIRLLEQTEKTVNTSGDWLLELYFTDVCGILFEQKPTNERARLWQDWYENIQWMKDLERISPRTRRIYKICCMFPKPIIWKLICAFRPWFCYNVRNIGARLMAHFVRNKEM